MFPHTHQIFCRAVFSGVLSGRLIGPCAGTLELSLLVRPVVFLFSGSARNVSEMEFLLK